MKTHLLRMLCLLPLATALMAEEGHEHAPAKPLTPEECFTVQCECKVPQYTCDECRYEIGLVKLDPALIRSTENTRGLVTIETVRTRVAQTFLPMTGEIALNERTLTHVSPRISGIARSVSAEQGARVEQDAVLFQLESAELGRAIGAYRKNKALTALALKNLERERELVEKKLSPEADQVAAQMTYDEYRVELESAEQTLAVMGLDSHAIQDLTSDSRVGKPATLPVRAPQNGTVIAKHLAPGETLEAGKEVLTLADLSSVWVWLDVYEHDLAALTAEAKKQPPRVQIMTPAFPDRTFEGVIDLFGATMSEDTRTVKVRVNLPNPEGLLRPGMFCEARAIFETPEHVIAVPTHALLSDEGTFFVFRLVREGYALRTAVETGRTFTDGVEITSGLKEGEKIVGRGSFLLKSDVLREKMGAGCAD